jgi:hypothetical protein
MRPFMCASVGTPAPETMPARAGAKRIALRLRHAQDRSEEGRRDGY